jgi:hypothetical protein
MMMLIIRNLVRSVGIAMGYGLDVRGWIPSRRKGFFSTSQYPDRFWGPHTHVYSRYRVDVSP